MLREFAEALEVLASREPLILILEDLQWSDSATLESLAYVARRRDPARLLVLATYRPVEAVLHNTRLRRVLAEVRNQPQVAEIVLDYLPREAVHAFLRQRCGAIPGLEALVDLLHHRTGGHPLFLASVVDELLRSLPRETDLNDRDLSAMALTIPLNVHRFIEHHLERLSDEDQSILEAASVAGHPFRVATVATFTSLAEDQVERRCAALARTHGMLAPDGLAAGPAGTVGPRYRFRHALFQETVYARISPERRARLHLLAGERLEAAYTAQPADTGAGSTIAAELAAHFEQGRDLTKAVKYLELAGRNALQRSAYGEAHDHVVRALKLVPHLVERAERSRVEAALSLLLAQVLESTQGWGAQDVAGMYSRARELSAAVHDEPRLLQATWGVIAVTVVRADLVKTQALAREMLTLARTRRNALFRMAAHAELGGTALALGRTASARRHFRLAEALHDPGGHRSSVAAFGMDLGIFARIWATHAMWYEGYPDRAVAHAEGAMTMAAVKGHVFTLTITRAYAAMLSQFRRDVAAVDRLATLALAQATEHGFAYYRAWADVLLGWSAGVRGKGQEALETLRRGVEVLQATAGLRLAYYRALIAETCGRIGRFDEGLQVLSSAFDDVRRTGECWWEPELHRLRGELLAGAGPSNDRDAERCYRTAIELAQRQHAPLLELRAAVSLTRLCQRHGRARETSSMLIRLTDRLTEGFGDSDVSDARLLIESATKIRKNARHARRRLP
jgi:tetratricopeptide (TPR) repeat protein